MIQRRNYLKRTPLRRVSKKRSRENAQYTKLRRAFLDLNTVCVVAYAIFSETLRTTQVHHIAGRTGKNFLDESTWLAVSRIGHEWIHQHPKEARARGWLRTQTGAELMKERAVR